MALCNSKSSTHFQLFQQSLPILFLFLLFPFANSISFTFPSFSQNDPRITYQGNATTASGVIQLTANKQESVGRATYSSPIHLWDNQTGNLADFNTHFSFIIRPTSNNPVGDGLSFFLSPYNATIPEYSSNGSLALFNVNTSLNHTKNQIVAVEFDTFQNFWDPSSNHVGIDVNGIESVANLTLNTSLANNETTNVWVNYNSTTKTLSVYLTYEENPVFQGNYILSYVVDLSTVLPEWVSVGFSAATGGWIEINNIVSWTFNSTLGGSNNSTPGVPPSNSTPGGPPSNSFPGGPPFNSTSKGTGHKKNLRLIVSLAVGVGALSCGVGLFWFMKRKQIFLQGKNMMDLDDSTDGDDFEEGTGSRRFTFSELNNATNNFSEGGKLGQGGFGGVYKGVLSDNKKEIAVKRISSTSKQGKKEYESEVRIISQLRHRNLVKLIGWCHERGEFILVYEFMPNGSLDNHLFGQKSKLTWIVRYKIARSLVAAILYLHEGWEQCVLHRDIKPSNILLDSNYNAKLGDFGLARLVDHELGSDKTTDLAGTMGYLAPECATTCKASKESDVYSFGVVALQIACGRKPMEANRDLGQVNLLEWVWSLYGKRQLFEAVDKDLMEYDKHQVERLMVLGLWCCHPNFYLRPSIRQAFNILTCEDPLPLLPSQMPIFNPMCMSSYASPIATIDSDKSRTQYLSGNHSRSYYSSLSVQSSKALFQ